MLLHVVRLPVTIDSEKSNVTRWGEIITNRLTVRVSSFLICQRLCPSVDVIVGAIKEGKLRLPKVHQ